jgi:hypothetical protein
MVNTYLKPIKETQVEFCSTSFLLTCRRNICLKRRKTELKRKRIDRIFTHVHGFPAHDTAKKHKAAVSVTRKSLRAVI